MNNRAELHCLTKMSEMTGLSDVKELILKAKELGMPAIAITDEDSVQSYPEAYRVWEKISSEAKEDESCPRIIFGLTTHLVEDRYLIVENDKGQSLDDEYVVVDLETTGFSPVTDEIIEIGAVRIKNGKISETFSELVKPRRSISEKIVILTGISNEMVANSRGIEEVLPDFVRFCGNATLVAHNADFDSRFLRENLKRLGISYEYTTVDTLNLSRLLLKDMKRHGLDKVAAAFDIPLSKHHRAPDDALCTAQIFLALIHRLKKDGLKSLSELAGISMKDDLIKRLPSSRSVILVKNTDGIRDLFELMSIANKKYINSGYLKIPKSLLDTRRKNLLIGSSMLGELEQDLLQDGITDRIKEIAGFYDYLEIEPIENYLFDKARREVTSEQAKRIVADVVALGKMLSIPVIATSNVHYTDKSDLGAYKVLRHAAGWRDSDDLKPKYYLVTADKMLSEFGFLGEDIAKQVVLENPIKLIEDIDQLQPIPSDRRLPNYPQASEKIRSLCYSGAKQIYGSTLPKEIEERIEIELKAVGYSGCESLYMLTHDIVQKSRDEGYFFGNRGCVGASMLSFLLGITETNPLPPHYYCSECGYSDFNVTGIGGFHVGDVGIDLPDKECPVCGNKLAKDGYDIPWETFLGFEGAKEPDFDINVDGEYQERLQNSVKDLPGVGDTCHAGIILTLGEREAYRYAQNYYKETRCTLRDEEVKDVASKLVGVKRRESKHPGGIVVTADGIDIYKYTPINADKSSIIGSTHIEYHSLDASLLKVDLLGHEGYTTLRYLNKETGVDPESIPLEDEGVMSLFSSTDALGIDPDDICGITVGTLGIGEFGGGLARELITRFKPQRLSDVIRIMGLNHGTNTWTDNAEKLMGEGVELQDCIAHRDDIMLYLLSKGFERKQAFSIAESVRKGRYSRFGMPDDVKQEMVDHGIPGWYIWSCEQIKYLFPKAHAASYALLSWRLLYYKLYYPEAFYPLWLGRLSEIGRGFVKNGYDYIRNTYETFMEKCEGKTDSFREQRFFDEVPVVLEMLSRGVNI